MAMPPRRPPTPAPAPPPPPPLPPIEPDDERGPADEDGTVPADPAQNGDGNGGPELVDFRLILARQLMRGNQLMVKKVLGLTDQELKQIREDLA